MPLSIVITGGGTGGHIIPALNIGDSLRVAAPDARIIYIGNRSSMEQKLAAERGYPFYPVRIASFRRDNLLANYKLPWLISSSLVNTIGYLRKQRIQLVVGTGGYASLPAIAAARLLGIPYVLQDQNAMPGMVTRWAAPRAARIFIAYSEARKHLKCDPSRIIMTGNPIVVKAGQMSKSEARSRFGLDIRKETLFVTGGSGGALSINKVINGIKDSLIEAGMNLIWQTGKHWDGMTEAPDSLGQRLYIKRFFTPEEMASAYQAADCAVARCGAMTLAELAGYSLPAVLVPFPFAAEGHQEANARSVEGAGGAVMINDREMTPESLLTGIQKVLAGRSEMSSAIGRLSVPDAAEKITHEILTMVGMTTES